MAWRTQAPGAVPIPFFLQVAMTELKVKQKLQPVGSFTFFKYTAFMLSHKQLILLLF